jgi:hypothetical protein
VAEKRNLYDDLMDDDIKPVAKPRPVVKVEKAPEKVSEEEPEPTSDGEPSTTIRTSPDSTGGEPKNAYDDLIGFDDYQSNVNMPQKVLATGITGASNVVQGMAPTIAESLTNAPSGSVSEIGALMSPKKSLLTAREAASAVINAKNPQVAPKGGGQAWLQNWANIQEPEFTGGVPEAAQKYQRGKPQGKVTSKLYKKFGNTPLNIQGQMVEAQIAAKAAIEAQKAAAAQAAEIARQTEAAASASQYSKYLNKIGKVGAVGGAGLGGLDVYNRLADKDTHGAIASGLGTAASLAPMFMGSAGVLPAAGLASPLYLMAHDRIEYLKRHPEEQITQEDDFDPMGNPLR